LRPFFFIEKFVRWLRYNLILGSLYRGFYSYSAPSNFSYLWNFGVFAFVCLGIQIGSGLLLAMHYIPEVSLAFDSVEHIMRDVNYGWLLRYVHANGASMFFIVVYVHIFRGLYYGSYLHPRQALWYIGIIMFLLMIVIAFMGYVLPWGQMSFWAATVITNLFSAIPVFGSDIVIWLWGGYSVGSPTLTRFFALHFFLPFFLLLLSFFHVIYLHAVHSNNPLGIYFRVFDAITFYPYYIVKDLFGIVLFFMFFAIFVFFFPNVLSHPDNYILANPMVTPSHIVPEWYFLPFYAILRSIPNKLLGVVALGMSIVSLFVLPNFFNSFIRSCSFKPFSQALFWMFVVFSILLGWIGSLPVQYPYVGLGQFFTFFYFGYFFIFGPALNFLDIDIWLIDDELVEGETFWEDQNFMEVFYVNPIVTYVKDLYYFIRYGDWVIVL